MSPSDDITAHPPLPLAPTEISTSTCGTLCSRVRQYSGGLLPCLHCGTQIPAGIIIRSPRHAVPMKLIRPFAGCISTYFGTGSCSRLEQQECDISVWLDWMDRTAKMGGVSCGTSPASMGLVACSAYGRGEAAIPRRSSRLVVSLVEQHHRGTGMPMKLTAVHRRRCDGFPRRPGSARTIQRMIQCTNRDVFRLSLRVRTRFADGLQPSVEEFKLLRRHASAAEDTLPVDELCCALIRRELTPRSSEETGQ